MSEKLSEQLKDIDELDLEKPSLESVFKKENPAQWRLLTSIMWLVFIAFVSISIFNNYSNSKQASLMLQDNTEVNAKVLDKVQILEDGKYTDYSVDLEVSSKGEKNHINLTVPEDIFESQYKSSQEIPIIFVNEGEYNLKSYYERRANMFSNWVSITVGYLIVFLFLYFIRHYLLKFICKARS